MATPRCRSVHPAQESPPPDPTHLPRLQRLLARLNRERAVEERGWQRLHRALNALQTQHCYVHNLERQLALLGEHPDGQDH